MKFAIIGFFVSPAPRKAPVATVCTPLNNLECRAGRVDLQRVLVLRTVSNYDREPPGVTVAESLKEMVSGNYSAYMPALEAAEVVGDKVVRDIVEHWADRESTIPHFP